MREFMFNLIISQLDNVKLAKHTEQHHNHNTGNTAPGRSWWSHHWRKVLLIILASTYHLSYSVNSFR